MKIYTKTGDGGETSLLGGKRVSKANLRIEAYGTFDELNSFTGLALASGLPTEVTGLLQQVQHELFVLGSRLAADPEKPRLKLPELNELSVIRLEDAIDELTAQLPEMTHFILPGGSAAVSSLHVARCVCRRAERATLRLASESAVEEVIIKYLNRLSDYLFVAARYTGFKQGVAEIKWMPESK